MSGFVFSLVVVRVEILAGLFDSDVIRELGWIPSLADPRPKSSDFRMLPVFNSKFDSAGRLLQQTLAVIKEQEDIKQIEELQ